MMEVNILIGAMAVTAGLFAFGGCLMWRTIERMEEDIEALKAFGNSDRSSTLNLYKSLSSRIFSLDTRVSGLEAIPLLRLFFRKKED